MFAHGESHSFEGERSCSSCSFPEFAQARAPWERRRQHRGRGMKEEDRIYYRHRAAREMELARAANHPNAVRAHALLARYYAEMIEKGLVPPFPATRRRLSLFARSR